MGKDRYHSPPRMSSSHPAAPVRER
jgi:hypothetical protein